MKKIASIALAGVLAATAVGASVTTAAAGNGWRQYDGPRYYYNRGPGPGPGLAAGALFGLALGAIASQAFAAPVYYPPAPVYPVYGDPNAAWCAQQYRSYNPQTNTWVDFEGVVHVCYGPY